MRLESFGFPLRGELKLGSDGGWRTGGAGGKPKGAWPLSPAELPAPSVVLVAMRARSLGSASLALLVSMVACATPEPSPCVDTMGCRVWNSPEFENRTLAISPGSILTIQLIEPEAYAMAPDGQMPPTTFPWLPPQSSDGAVLRPVELCRNMPLEYSLPETVTAFRGTKAGTTDVIARLNPRYHPAVQGLPPLHLFHVRVVVPNSGSS
jgi:hypothetical protein